jgi:hypothetical protein
LAEVNRDGGGLRSWIIETHDARGPICRLAAIAPATSAAVGIGLVDVGLRLSSVAPRVQIVLTAAGTAGNLSKSIRQVASI